MVVSGSPKARRSRLLCVLPQKWGISFRNSLYTRCGRDLGSSVGRMLGPPTMPKSILLEEDPLWYKDAVIYEVHVRAFFDESGDGMGDFAGLTQKLDYLQDLGVTAIWMLPFCPSPWRDD